MFLGLILIISLANGEVSGKLLPAFIHLCPTPVPKPDCLKRTIQEVIPIFVKGIPSLGVDSSDPLYRDVEHLEPLPGFRVELKNGKVTGLRKCIVDSAKYDRNQLNATIHCNVTVRGHYKAVGRILIVNMNGDGDAKLTSKNVIVKVKVKFEDHIRNGIVYHDVKNFTLKHRFADRVTFGLTNLFKGNPQLSQQVLLFLNENWSAVAAEIGGPIINVGAVAIFNILKQFFGTVPKNEIFPYL